jgi:tripartite ATP-independent transporter DctM subunit
MSIESLTLIIFGLLIFYLILGAPLVFALGGTAVIATYFFWGPDALFMVASRTFSSANSFVFLAIPMFIFMGNMLDSSGIAQNLYSTIHKWMGGVRGGLAIGTVIICAVFAAMVGVSGAATVTMGLIALPAMLAHRYHKDIAIGCIASGGTLGVLIPPSVMMIILGFYTNTSIGRLFAGGIIPGFMLAVFFCVYIFIRCLFNKNLGPALSKEHRYTFTEKLISLKSLILPLLLIIGVLGSIFSGAATPSEAAAIGAFGSIVCSAVYGTLNWENIKKASITTLRLSCMVMWIIFGAAIFTNLYTAIGAQDFAHKLLTLLPGGAWGTLIGMQIILLILGCFLDPTGIIMITTPIFFPVALSLGFDPVWFGVLYCINMELGFITPPFGFNLFYMQSVAPEGVSMVDIYRSIYPYILLGIFSIIVCMIFPGIVLWLPNLIFG